jgi:pimeloyl-ACP methyl ester carboxylesterase
MNEATSKPVVVLVHGAFANRHAFDAVVPALQARGYQAVAPDLPGHGDDRTPLPDISLDSYIQVITDVVRQYEQVILVGHSMAGMIISAVAEREPDRVAALIFVAAYLPTSGQTLQALASGDGESLVGKHMQFAPDYATVTIARTAVAEAICADLPVDFQNIIVESQKPEPLKPFQGAVSLSEERFGRVRKAYLQTSNDRAVTPSLQGQMLAAYPNMPRRTLATSHLPFLAQPNEFVAAVLDLAADAS